MNKIFWLFVIIFSQVLGENNWMEEQISQDLEYLSTHPVSRSSLYDFFVFLSGENRQLVYCRIRNNVLTCSLSVRKDGNRNQHIFPFLNSLVQRYKIPDVEFILSTEDGVGGDNPFPIFAFSKVATGTNIITFPDFEMLQDVMKPGELQMENQCSALSNSYPWSGKEDLAFFRGVSTGGYDPSREDFGNDRYRVVVFSALYPELVDAAFNQIFQPSIAEKLQAMGKPTEGASMSTHFQFKYLLDVNGNSCCYSRTRWILYSNSTLVKVLAPKMQWYYKAMKPWVHYVPIESDLSDLETNLHLLKENDHIAYVIAMNGQKLAKEIFSKQLVEEYVVKLLKAYSSYVIVQ